KGLSDVVTTVLIILFAIVAVAVVGGIVMNQINKAGKNIDKAGLCTENIVEPLTCTTSATQSVVGLKRNSGTATISAINLAFTKADGSVGSVAVAAANEPDNAGQAASGVYTAVTAQNAKSVKATAIYFVTGSSGDTATCESKVLDCTSG
ncbi:MAG: hypothetical protein Q8Q31_04535, partial [Nanoarchaeota archaeon]|nr:hypothetical protein [Nanoarchaeota archaeon]